MPKRPARFVNLDQFNDQRRTATALRRETAVGSQDSNSSDESDNDIPYWPEEDDEDEHPLEEEEKDLLVLKWVPNAKLRVRKPHLGTSRFATWRRKSEQEKRARSMAGNKTLFEFWNQSRNAEDIQEPEEEVLDSRSEERENQESDESRIRAALDILENSMQIEASNRAIERALRVTSKRDFLRLLCVHRFLKALLEKKPRIETSEQIATSFFPSKARQWTGRQIRIWSEQFLSEHRLPEKNQGSHIKIKSLISDENTQSICLQFLRSQKAHMISGNSFSEWINCNLHLELGLPASLELRERTATRWLHVLNFNVGDVSRKGSYIDGHERADVLEYRKEFLARVEKYQLKMPIYTGDTMETRIMPEIEENEKPLVFVVHDESCFQSNDSGKTGWFDEDRRPIRPKSNGKSLMVSAFLCECHGLLRVSDDQRQQHPDVELD